MTSKKSQKIDSSKKKIDLKQLLLDFEEASCSIAEYSFTLGTSTSYTHKLIKKAKENRMEIIKAKEETPKKLTIKDTAYGIALMRKKDKTTIMKVKPTSFLLNSTLIADQLNKSSAFIVNLVTGTLFVIEGDEEVRVLPAKLLIEELPS